MIPRVILEHPGKTCHYDDSMWVTVGRLPDGKNGFWMWPGQRLVLVGTRKHIKPTFKYQCGQRLQHVKSGGFYTILESGLVIEWTGEFAYLYQATDGTRVVRAYHEIEDESRFRVVTREEEYCACAECGRLTVLKGNVKDGDDLDAVLSRLCQECTPGD